MTDRIPHPRWSYACVMLSSVGINLTAHLIVFEEHGDPACSLHDFHGKRMKKDSRHARGIAAVIDGIVGFSNRERMRAKGGSRCSVLRLGPGSHGGFIRTEGINPILTSARRRTPLSPNPGEIG